MVRIEVGSSLYTVSDVVFRRLLTSSLGALTRLKELEMSQLPKVDKEVLVLIRDIQFDHKDMI